MREWQNHLHASMRGGLQPRTSMLRTGVLDRLLAAQRLDRHDVEGVFPLLQALLQRSTAGQPADAQLAAAEEPLEMDATPDELQAAAQLLALDTEAACEVLREYLIAAAAKDCSLMITLAPVLDAQHLGPQDEGRLQQDACIGSVLCDEWGHSKRWFRYKVAFVDLDLKPLAKIGVHYELDQAIMACCANLSHMAYGIT